MRGKIYQHWELMIDDKAIAWLTLDKKNSDLNVLDEAVLKELDEISQTLKKQKKLKGAVLRSGKKTGFIAGADVEAFTQLENRQQAYNHILKVQAIFNRWEQLPFPTVAMIDGFCLGGGLELSLACRYRIATLDLKTKLGLPEVKLGIHPGWGGTVRLVDLLGVFKAMPLMLSGRLINAKKAKKIGLVDAAVPHRIFEETARYYIHKKPDKQQPALWLALLDTKVMRPWIGRLFQKKLVEKVNPKHYPAPYRLLKRWIRDGALGPKAMTNEAKSVSRLLFSSASKQLVRLFFLQTRLKKLGQSKDIPIKHLHVLGAGMMGAGIAAQGLLSGLKVSLQDKEPEQMTRAIQHIKRVVNKRLSDFPSIQQQTMDRLLIDTKGYEIPKADVVIEAIFENLEAKQALFKAIEPSLKKEAVIATNTSTLPLTDIRTVLKRPERLVGIHFFNPVDRMLLVEVVSEKDTEEKALSQALAFVNKINKLPLPVRSAPGFLVNRILVPYLLEGMLMLEEKHSAQSIDEVAKKFGMPMGPIELADTVGLDICLNAAEILTQHLGGEIPKILIKHVKKKHLGKKVGKGFYTYNKQGKIQLPQFKTGKPLPNDVIDRLILSMANEAVACLDQEIVTDEDLLDAAMVFGTGFAPFRGGIMQHLHSEGLSEQKAKLEILAERYGKRFKPVKGWHNLVKRVEK